MRRPSRGSSHFHWSSLYGPTLKISNLLPLFLTFIVFPITYTQMTNNPNIPENNLKNTLNGKDKNNTLHKIYETNTTVKNYKIVSAVSKQYQTFLDRVRRKSVEKSTTEEIHYDNGNFIQNLDHKSTKHNFNVRPETNSLYYHQKHSLKLHNVDLINAKDAEDTSAIEKLRIADETRTKIFHDYYSTVNKVNTLNKEPNTNESITADVLDYNETIDILFNETGIPETESDTKIPRRFSNDSLVFPDTRNLSSPRAPTITQTPLPGFVEGMSDLNATKFNFLPSKNAGTASLTHSVPRTRLSGSRRVAATCCILNVLR